MRAFAAVATTAVLMLALTATAVAKTVSIAPSARHGERIVFSLSALRGKASAVAGARLVVGRHGGRAVRRAVVRRGVRRGSLTLHVGKGAGRVRLVVTVDRSRPTRPGGVTAVAGAGGVALTWAGSRDDVRVAGYRILRDGKRTAAVGRAARSYVDATVRAGSTYDYTVVAVDTVGRSSRRSAVAAATVPQPGSVAAPSAPLSPSGEGVPTGNLPGWTQVLADDFATNVAVGAFPGAVADRWWTYNDGTPDTSGHGRYYASRVISLHDGLMDFHVRTENGQPLVAVALPRLAGIPYGQVYGRYAMRFRADSLPGYQIVPLLWPDSQNWPADGEIDFPGGLLNDSQICGFKFSLGPSGTESERFCVPGVFSTWHTAVVEWTASAVQYYLDGQLIGTSTTRIPSTPMHWVLQVETAEHDPSPPSASVDGHVLVDWVAAWRAG